MKYICPLITVSDITRSRKFYEELLGQEVKMDFGENVTFHGDFAIHLKSHFNQLIGDHEIRSGGNNFELYFEHNDLDDLVEKLKTEGVGFVHELREQPWRQKVVRIYDPDNNMIEVGESLDHLCYRLYREGLDTEQIMKVTYMTMEFVDESIERLRS